MGLTIHCMQVLLTLEQGDFHNNSYGIRAITFFPTPFVLQNYAIQPNFQFVEQGHHHHAKQTSLQVRHF